VANFDGIGEYGLNELLARRLTTPGGSVSGTVAPELFPVLTLENDRPEWSYLKSEGLYGRSIGVSAVAGQFSMAQIYLPTTARSLVVITGIQNWAANNISIARLVGISGGLGGWAARVTCARDTRRNGNGSAATLETNANVAQPTNFGDFATLFGANARYTAPIVIAPGGAIGIFPTVVNSALTASIEWYERPAQPGELV